MKFKTNWKRFWTLSRSSDGFTLVELIVVIAILAILAGVAVPAYSGYITKANMTNDQTLISDVADALQLHYYNNGDLSAGGYVVLTPEGTVSAADTFGTAAMDAVFGDGWEETVSLSYDAWSDDPLFATVLKQGSTAASVGNSSFLTGSTTGELLSDVSDLTNTAFGFLANKNLAPDLLYSGIAGNFATSDADFQELCEEVGIEVTTDANNNPVFADSVDNTQLANLMVLAAAKDITAVSNDTTGTKTASTASNLVLMYATYTAVANSSVSNQATKDAYAAMNEAFKSATSVNDVQNALDAFASDPAFQNTYAAYDSSNLGDTDGGAFLNIMEAVDSASGSINSDDLKDANLYKSGTIADSFNNYVSAAGAVSSLTADQISALQTALANAPEGSVAVVLSSTGPVCSATGALLQE